LGTGSKGFQSVKGMMTMDFFSGKANTTSTQPDKPWIHVRAALINKLWLGLAVFSTSGAWTALPRQQQSFFTDAAGA
jgi:hypothetical protein